MNYYSMLMYINMKIKIINICLKYGKEKVIEVFL